MTAELMTLIILIVSFLGTVFVGIFKYGADQQAQKSEVDAIRTRVIGLEELVKEEKAHNQNQHEEFYKNRNDTIEIKTNMDHIMRAILDIKNILDRRQSP